MALFINQPSDEGLPGRERALAMVAVMTMAAMVVFDGSMINIALPQIARSLNASVAATVWVANGYLLSAAMTLAIFAALSSRLGLRTIFTFGLSVFTLASVGCALSTSLDMLIVMRIFQGIGGAATLSIGPAILRSVFPNRLLGRILGADGMDMTNGITTFNEGYSISAVMAAAAHKVVAVLDATKFNRRGFNQVLPIEHINCIITDDSISNEDKAQLEASDVEMVIV